MGNLVTAAELRENSLYPRFLQFHANYLAMHYRLVPGQLNGLISAWEWVRANSKERLYLEHMRHARITMVDSGGVGVIAQILQGKATRVDLDAWLARPAVTADIAWKLHNEGGVTKGVAASMDMPVRADTLEPCGMTMSEARKLTVENGVALMQRELPPGWKRFYAIQGLAVADYMDNLDAYENAGIMDDVRAGAWLGIGGSRNRKRHSLFEVYHAVREAVGDDVWIHALGVGRPDELTYLVRRRLCESADSSAAAQELTYNRSAYVTVRGGMPTYVVDALMAATAMRRDALLARALDNDDDVVDGQQGGLFGDD